MRREDNKISISILMAFDSDLIIFSLKMDKRNEQSMIEKPLYNWCFLL